MDTPPRIIVVTGPPGSGKTVLSSALAQHWAIPWMSRDVIKQGLAWPNGLPTGDANQHNVQCNHAFTQSVSALIQHRVSLVCEAAFQHPLWQQLTDIWRVHAHIVVIQCHIPEDLRMQRLQQRLNSAPERHGAHDDHAYLQHIHTHQYQYFHGAYPTLAITTNAPIPQLVTHIADWVAQLT